MESPFAALRLRTDAAKPYKKVANGTAVIWKQLMIAERALRRPDAPELLFNEICQEVPDVDGRMPKTGTWRKTAPCET